MCPWIVADENLRAEGVGKEKIFFVSIVMIDTLMKHRVMASKLDSSIRLGMEAGKYATLTLYRPSSVDDRVTLEGILGY